MRIKRKAEKVGRNDNCPCGSGVKYKKCCLKIGVSKTEQSIYSTNPIFIDGRSDRLKSMKSIAHLVFKRAGLHPLWKKSAGTMQNTPQSENQRVKVVLNEIHKCANELLHSCRHSMQYWFQLIRRLSPLLSEELREICEPGDRPELKCEGRIQILKEAENLVLSCSPNADVKEWVEEGEIKGIDYRGISSQELLTVANLFSLGQLRFEAQVNFRLTCKGFNVFSNGSSKVATQCINSINRYEARRDRFDTLAGVAGLWCDPVQANANRKGLCSWIMILPFDEIVLESEDPPFKIALNFMLSRIDFPQSENAIDEMAAIYKSRAAYDFIIEHKDLRKAFESAFGFQSEQIVAFVYSTFQLIDKHLFLGKRKLANNRVEMVWGDVPVSMREMATSHLRDASTMGFLRSSKSSCIDALYSISNEIHMLDNSVPKLDKNQIEYFVNIFSWKNGMPTYSNDPRLFVDLSPHTLVINLLWLGDFIKHLLLKANTVSKDKSNAMYGCDLTGAWLENQAASYFLRELHLSPDKIIKGRVVRKKEKST